MTLAEKYDTTKTWGAPCCTCKQPVQMTAARWEALGTYHVGCFGYPACSCQAPHQGECPDPPEARLRAGA